MSDIKKAVIAARQNRNATGAKFVSGDTAPGHQVEIQPEVEGTTPLGQTREAVTIDEATFTGKH